MFKSNGICTLAGGAYELPIDEPRMAVLTFKQIRLNADKLRF
jgi:hypothetical protein